MHSTDNMDDGYLGSGKILRYSFSKHGIENHERVILEDCSVQGRVFLREREKIWVGEEQLRDSMCMNLVPGGSGGDYVSLSAQTRQRISKSLIGNKRAKGMKMPEEAKRKISEAQKGKQRSPFSDEWRAAISRAAKRRFENASECEKVSAGMKRRWKDQDYRSMILSARAKDGV